LSWQVVQGCGSKGSASCGSRLSYSIGGSLNGSRRVPRQFPTEVACDAPSEHLPLPFFALKTLGITLPTMPQPTQSSCCPPTSEQHSSEPLPHIHRTPLLPHDDAVLSAESFFGTDYRPLAPKSSPSPAIAAASPTEPAASAGSKRPASLSDDSPTKVRRSDSDPQTLSATAQSEPLTVQQQMHNHGRRCRWARQHDASYLQR
jgi:hypothetical protein